MVDLFRNRHWDLVSKRGIYYIISALMLLIGMVALFTRGLNLGLDFKGGGLVTYTVQGNFQHEAAIIEQVREKLAKTNDPGLQGAEVKISPGQNAQIVVQTLVLENQDQDTVLDGQVKNSITPAVNEVLKANGMAEVTAPDSQDMVSGTVSGQLVTQGIIALVIGSVLIMLWIGVRYNIGGLGFRYSLGGIIALVHDLLTLIGMFALFRDFLHVNSPFIAALLTVLGYSIHDTIIIYDRIRENIRLRKGRTFAETVNISLLETMARSVNTILTVLFTLLALFFFGGSTLRDFTAAMLIGIVIGGYSSIFVASQVLVSWAKGKDREILPPGEKLTPAVAMAAPAPAAAPQPVTASLSASIAEPQSSMDKEAIQRARQAGKTSKRRR